MLKMLYKRFLKNRRQATALDRIPIQPQNKLFLVKNIVQRNGRRELHSQRRNRVSRAKPARDGNEGYKSVREHRSAGRVGGYRIDGQKVNILIYFRIKLRI